jgi:protein-tyrosine phosphatase
MARRNIDISPHRSAALTEEMVQQADQIFVMTAAHREAVVNMVPSAAERVVLLLADRDVNDPIGGSENDYEACAGSIQEGVLARLQEVMG